MSLTGTPFLGLVLMVTLTAIVVLVLLWPRLAGLDLRRVAARLGLLLTINALVLLTAATQLNAQFLFFADWADLGGALGGRTTTTSLTRGGSATAAVRRSVSGTAAAAGAVLPPLPTGVSADGVVTYTVTGPLSGITARVVVQLPPGYGAPANAAVRYPVLETFQGYPGGPITWIRSMHLGTRIGEAVRAGTMREALIVSPQVEIPAGVDTECVDGRPGSPQVETWLARDVPDWVARTFRVQTARTSWATIGLSAGGWCAAMVAMLHPAQYSGAIVMGGYFRPDFGVYEPFPATSPLKTRYDLVATVGRSPPPVAVWLETSHADALSYRSSAAFLKRAKAPLSVDAVVLQHAGHRFSVWQGLLPTSLAWLGKNIPGFAPLP
jgi:enterochelin esterase-like enzyme